MSRQRTRQMIAAAVAATALSVSLGSHRRAVAAQPPATQAAPAGDATAMKAKVVDVQGSVRVRTASDQPWQAATVGMEVGEGAEFRTGPRSSVRCVIPPDQEIIIDRLTTMKISEAIQQGGTIKTDLTMKYGRTQYNIQAAGAQHEATIRSPSSTLAVRGTRVMLYDQPPFTPEARSFIGRAVFTDAKKQIAVGSPTRGARILSDRNNTAETALDETVVDPVYAAARTSSEAQYVAQETSRGGVVRFDERLGINTVRNSPPLTDRELVASALPGDLNFVLRWDSNADLDISIVDEVGDPGVLLTRPLRNPKAMAFAPNETLYPGLGLNTTSSGGRILFNHRGGASGGQEIAFWPSPAPHGIYSFQALHASGDTTAAKFNAFYQGRALEIQAQKVTPDGLEPAISAGVIRFNQDFKYFVYDAKFLDPSSGEIFTQPDTPINEGEFVLTDANGNLLFDRNGNPQLNSVYDPVNNPTVFDAIENPTGVRVAAPTQVVRTLGGGDTVSFSFFIPPDFTIPDLTGGETGGDGAAAGQRRQAPPINPTKAQRREMQKEARAQKRAVAAAEAASKRNAAREAKAQKAQAAREAKVAAKASR